MKHLLKYYLLLCLWSCAEKKEPPRHYNQISKISFISGGCYGTCPVLAIEIDSTLTYKFHGISYCDEQGFFKGTISKSFWDSINSKLERSNFKILDSSYDYNQFDAALFKIVIHYRGDQKTIFGDYTSIPNELQKTLTWIENSYPYVDLHPVDTLEFEAKFHSMTNEEVDQLYNKFERFRENLGRPEPEITH